MGRLGTSTVNSRKELLSLMPDREPACLKAKMLILGVAGVGNLEGLLIASFRSIQVISRLADAGQENPVRQGPRYASQMIFEAPGKFCHVPR